jgi:thiol-disulfide isomerase/thioredoxin
MKSIIVLALALVSLGWSQDKPQDIPKKDLPSKGKCLMCVDEGEEKLAGGVMYKGKAYYFCNTKEIAAFKKDPETYAPSEEPREAPTFAMTDTAGKLWDAEAMKGKLILIDFWATWCKPCIAMMPALDKVHAKYKSRGFEILSVNIDQDRALFEGFLKKHKFPNPVLYDAEHLWQKWNIRTIPATFLIKDGKVVAQWVGQQSEKSLASKIEKLLPEK